MLTIGLTTLDVTYKTLVFEGGAMTITQNSIDGGVVHGQMSLDGTSIDISLPLSPEQLAILQDYARTLESKSVTGMTTKLVRQCRECSESLPDDAKFCIACRAPAYL